MAPFNAVMGMVLNTSDDRLAPDSPWRTREEARYHAPVFVLEGGYPVWEVWFWFDEAARWFCWTRSYDVSIARQGVVYFDSLEQLRAQLAHLRGQRAHG